MNKDQQRRVANRLLFFLGLMALGATLSLATYWLIKMILQLVFLIRYVA